MSIQQTLTAFGRIDVFIELAESSQQPTHLFPGSDAYNGLQKNWSPCLKNPKDDIFEYYLLNY